MANKSKVLPMSEPRETNADRLNAFRKELQTSLAKCYGLDADAAGVIARDVEGIVSLRVIKKKPLNCTLPAESSMADIHEVESDLSVTESEASATAGINEAEEADHDVAVRVIRVEPQYRDPLKVDSRDTIAKACCGRKFANVVFRISKRGSLPLMASWMVAILVGFAGLAGFGPAELALAWPLVAIPVHFINFCLMSRVLVWKLLGEWETVFLAFLSLSYVIVMCDVVRADPARVAGVGSFFFVLLDLCFTDARLPRETNKAMGFFYGMCAVLSLVGITTSQLGFTPDLQPRKIKVSLGGIDVEMDTLLFANYRLLTVCLFLIKNSYLKCRHPEAFVVIKARIQSIRTTARTLLQEQPRKQRLSQLPDFGSHVAHLGSMLGRSKSSRSLLERPG